MSNFSSNLSIGVSLFFFTVPMLNYIFFSRGCIVLVRYFLSVSGVTVTTACHTQQHRWLHRKCGATLICTRSLTWRERSRRELKEMSCRKFLLRPTPGCAAVRCLPSSRPRQSKPATPSCGRCIGWWTSGDQTAKNIAWLSQNCFLKSFFNELHTQF